jgi:polysaccharide pyruvyl transferase WcaK-like protein
MKINIVGWFGKKNIGDEAFKDAFRIIFLGHDIQFFTPPQQCPEADLVILGGGAVISPYYLQTMPKNSPKYILGASIEYESEMDLLSPHNFQSIMIRNSSDVLKLKNKVTCPVKDIPDLAFLLNPGEHKINLGNKNKKLGVMVTDYINPALNRSTDKFGKRSFNFIQNLAKELDDFIKNGWDVILIPLSTDGYGNDLRINLDLMAFMQKQPINITESLSPTEVISVIKDLDLAMCMKFHAHIFSIIAETPFVSIEFTRKVRLLLEENNLTELKAAWFEGDDFHCNFNDVTEKALKNNYSELFSKIRKSKVEEILLAMQEIRQDWLGNKI